MIWYKNIEMNCQPIQPADAAAPPCINSTLDNTSSIRSVVYFMVSPVSSAQWIDPITLACIASKMAMQQQKHGFTLIQKLPRNIASTAFAHCSRHNKRVNRKWVRGPTDGPLWQALWVQVLLSRRHAVCWLIFPGINKSHKSPHLQLQKKSVVQEHMLSGMSCNYDTDVYIFF